MPTAVLCVYSHLEVVLPVLVLRTLSWLKTGEGVRATAPQHISSVPPPTSVYHSGGSVILKMTVEMLVTSLRHVPSLNVYQDSSNVTEVPAFTLHNYVMDKQNVMTELMKKIVTR